MTERYLKDQIQETFLLRQYFDVIYRLPKRGITEVRSLTNFSNTESQSPELVSE